VKTVTTWLECINCGFQTDLVTERKFRCPKCGDLFDVKHDIPKKSTSYWMRLFDARLRSEDSGVWRFREWIMPNLPVPEKNIVSLGEGIVPIVPAGFHLKKWLGGSIEPWLILEGKSPTSSFKDFGMTVLVSVAKAAGVKAIVCASTGDTSASLAAYAGAARIQCAVIIPEGKITPEQILQAQIFGAKVITLPGPFDDCMTVLQELVADYQAYPGNSLNPTRIEGHQATVFLVAQFFKWTLPDCFVVPIGNGSNCSSIGKALHLMKSLGFKAESRILGCQSEAANPMFLSWQKAGGINTTREKWEAAFSPTKVGDTIATAMRIGNPVSYKKVIREITESRGAMVEASDDEAREAVLACAQGGHFVCPQTGIALAGLKRAINQGFIENGERVVVVSTADGLKFTHPFHSYFEGKFTRASNCQTETVANILGL